MEYIGPNEHWNNLVPAMEIDLIAGQQYPLKLMYDGPQVIVNGQPVIDPDCTVWACFNNGIRIPYAPNVVSNFWR